MASSDIQVSQLPTLVDLTATDILHIKRGIVDYKVSYSELFKEHTSNKSNPHDVTKIQVGLGNVTNDAQLKMSSNLMDIPSKGAARTNLDVFSTDEVKNQIRTQHGDLKDNPHQVTKAQVGLGLVNNGNWSSSFSLDSGTTYATAKAVKDGVDNAKSLATSTLNDFKARTDNPHQVTKAQVGLSSVNNGTWSNSYTSISSTTYATSKAVKDGVDSAKNSAQSALNTFAARRDNPHDVTRSQIGLGSVNNGTWSSNWNNNSVVTYATTAAVYGAYQKAVESGKSDLATHVASSNPHGISKTTIGLSLVNNGTWSNSYTSASSNTYATSKAVKDGVDSAKSFASSSINTALTPTVNYARTDYGGSFTLRAGNPFPVLPHPYKHSVGSGVTALSTSYRINSGGLAQISWQVAVDANSTRRLAMALQYSTNNGSTWTDCSYGAGRTDEEGEVCTMSGSVLRRVSNNELYRVILKGAPNGGCQGISISFSVSTLQ